MVDNFILTNWPAEIFLHQYPMQQGSPTTEAFPFKLNISPFDDASSAEVSNKFLGRIAMPFHAPIMGAAISLVKIGFLAARESTRRWMFSNKLNKSKIAISSQPLAMHSTKPLTFVGGHPTMGTIFNGANLWCGRGGYSFLNHALIITEQLFLYNRLLDAVEHSNWRPTGKKGKKK